MKPGRKKGCTNSPSHRAAISDGHAERRGFTDQEVLDYVEAGHSIREAGERFGVSFQRISQILIKYGRSRPPHFHIRQRVAPVKSRPILDAEPAYAFSDLSTNCWHAIAERDRMERSWQYHWERKDTALFNRAKEAGQVVVVQSQTADWLVAYGKLVAR